MSTFPPDTRWSKWLTRPLSHRWRYALLGVLLSWGSPLGLLAIRFWSTHAAVLAGWWVGELTAMGWVYLYTAVGTGVVFGVVGYLGGLQADRLHRQTHDLQKLSEELRSASNTDGLTGLFVHRYLLERLGEEIRRSHRYNYPIAGLFMDVDDFKTLNDRHGHLFGDQVLRAIARVMAKAVRDTDILGRYGGDEFLAVLPETGQREACHVAERIRREVESLAWTGPHSPGPVTVSVGVYVTVPSSTSIDRFLKVADQALLRSKRDGKNRVHVHELSNPRVAAAGRMPVP